MDVNFKISDHAIERFRERFCHITLPISSLIASSIVFGGQKGSDYLLLNKEYEVVFPIACYDGEHTVKSVLTLQQAKANLSLINNKIEFETLFTNICDDIRKLHQEEVSKSEEEIINNLKFLAREYLSILPEGHRSCPGPHLSKCLKKKIKKKLPASNTQIDKFFIGEMARIIRESDWSCLSSKSNWSSIEEVLASCCF